MTGRFPITFLRMQMPPNVVDVNVHPAKLEVRFQDGGKLYSQLLSTIRNKFLSTDLTAKAELNTQRAQPVMPVSSETDRSFQLQPPEQETQERIPFQNPQPTRDWTSPAPATNSLPSLGGTPDFRPFPSEPQLTPTQPTDFSATTEHAVQPISRPQALQVHNTYLISETEEGMVVIDQHALHERIIYEQLREKVLNGKLESQKLLVPEPVTLPPAEAAAVLDNDELLLRIGISVEPFGGDTVLVAAYPAMLANQNPAETLKNIIDLLLSDGHEVDQRDILDELLHMISCKAAVKAGDKLTPEEINDLLEHRDYCQDAHHCPHGRPTALVFSREELDKRFKRI